MKAILLDIKEYWQWVSKIPFFLSVIFLSILVFCNYYFHWQTLLLQLPLLQEWFVWFLIFFIAFFFPYLLQAPLRKLAFTNRAFGFLLIIAPLLFAWKMVYPVAFHFSDDLLQNKYWNKVAYWPVKLAVVAACLFAIWKVFDRDQPFYGFSKKGFSLKPYGLMLLIMVPLIAAASTQPDFLRVYPKLMRVEAYITGNNIGLKKLLYELSYGIDFVSIELFFRGFLILAFVKWAGRNAILPMALFYCTIHFGKPLGECISSFFGGIILGVVTYHTRSIYGGLLVHLGIAWLMELGGFVGAAYLLGD